MHWKSFIAGALIFGIPLGVAFLFDNNEPNEKSNNAKNRLTSDLNGLKDGSDSDEEIDSQTASTQSSDEFVRFEEFETLRLELTESLNEAARKAVRDEVKRQVDELGEKWKGFLFSPHDDRFYSSLLELSEEQLEPFVVTRSSIQEARIAILYRTLARESYDPDLFRDLMHAIRAEELLEMGQILDSEQLEVYSQWTGEAGMEYFPGRIVQVEVEDLLNEQMAEMAKEILERSKYDRLETDPVEISTDPGEYLQIPIRTQSSIDEEEPED